MKATIQEVKEFASDLSLSDRAELVEFLIRSLDAVDQTDAIDSWLDLAADRMDEIKSGKVEGIPAKDVLKPSVL